MPARRQYECIVCGRKFPEGQGIVIKRAGITLAFHSKSCLSKFFKLFVERLDEREFRRAARDVMDELRQMREARAKRKVI